MRGRGSWRAAVAEIGRAAVVVTGLAVTLGAIPGCASSDGPTGPVGPSITGVLVLNSVGQTMRAYEVGEAIEPSGLPIDLGPLFDGNGMDLVDFIAVTTESDFGGDRVLVVDVLAASARAIGFAEEDVNPSKPTIVPTRSSAFVGGRATNSLYEVELGLTASPPAVFARDVGEFIEKVVVSGNRLFAIDSNIDDAGGTFEPLGPSRVVVYDLSGERLAALEMPSGFQATDAVVSGGLIVVLNAGTLTPSFAPEGNGNLAIIDPATLEVSGPFPLQGNGVSLEDGADGRVYVTVTSDFIELRTLRFDASGARFINGPQDPVATRDASGADIPCWVTSALTDGRLVCATFRFEEAGRLFLLADDGGFLGSVEGGFGTTDLEIVTP